MSLTARVQVVVFTSILTLVISIAVHNYVAGNVSQTSINAIVKGVRGGGGSDDAPIIMAGGSFYVATGTLAMFTDNSTQLNYTSGFLASAIDIIDDAGTPSSSAVNGSTHTLLLHFCKNSNCGGLAADKEDITLTMSTSGIVLSNGRKNIEKLGGTLWRHKMRKWVLLSVTVDSGNPISCAGELSCLIVVHSCMDGVGCL